MEPEKKSDSRTRSDSGPLIRTDVARSGEGAPCYRIPALARVPDGRLLAAFDARPDLADIPSPIALAFSWSSDSGNTWTPPAILRTAPPPQGFGDPSIVVDEMTGRIMIFHVGSAGAGFLTGSPGLDADDPQVTHPDVSVSDDGGRTWRHRRLTAELREPGWAGMFASSGAGIQLQHGRCAGRLLQQYTVRVDGQNFAVSAYSDDHGETWRHSELVGPGADENKVVELADGTVLLNCRARPCRTQARSCDGGVTWEPLTANEQLPDPGNNGSIIRAFPHAAPGSRQARILLCSNTADEVARRHLTVKVSYDEGATWPGRLPVYQGPAAYSTLVNLADGRYGLAFERDGYQAISFACFDFDDLHSLDAEVSLAADEPLTAGETTRLHVHVAMHDDPGEAPGLAIRTLPGWEAETVQVAAMRGTQTVEVAVTPAPSCAGHLPLTLLLHSDGRVAARDVWVSVVAAGPPVLQVAAERVVDAVGAPDADGKRPVSVDVPVRNIGNRPAHVEVSADGDPVVLELAPGELGVARGPGLRYPTAPSEPVEVTVRASADGLAAALVEPAER